MSKYETGYMDRKQVYPAIINPLGSASGYPANGWFAMHITYPDTEYADEIDPTVAGGFQYGQNTQSWRQGFTVIIRTPLGDAGGSAVPAQPTSDTTNVVLVDLHAAASANGGVGYNLGSEEATRLIAAKINSQRVRQVGERGTSRYLRARYVKMSGRESYAGLVKSCADDATTLRVYMHGAFGNGAPSDLPEKGEFVVTSGGSINGDPIDGHHTASHSPVATRRYTYNSIRFVRPWLRDDDDYVAGGLQPAAYTHGDGIYALGGIVDLIGITDKELGTTMHTGYMGGGTNQISGALTRPMQISIDAAPPQHTVVVSWELDNATADGGYWAEANGGPIIQGLGQTLPVWHLAAKPMDGGNMGLPALNYNARGGTAVKHTENHGFCRFSIEGLNSCDLPDMPPPDFTITEPAIQGVTAANPLLDRNDADVRQLQIAKTEYGTKQPTATQSVNGIVLSEGKTIAESAFMSPNTIINKNEVDELGSLDQTLSLWGIHGESYAAHVSLENTELQSNYIGTNSTKYSQQFFVKRKINEERVRGLKITNEEQVFDDLAVVDDLGNQLTLNGGSPFGTIIRDFKVENISIDPDTGFERIGPSTGNAKLTPNLRIQLPDPDQIPGGIFVRSAHDRIQAHSDKTWGLGGIEPPHPSDSGTLENTFLDTLGSIYGLYHGETSTNHEAIENTMAIGEVSQFDTHDRMLVFHCERILHPDISTKQGLSSSITPGAVPSGTTRIYSSHRITDHAERGSVAHLTNNGLETGELVPHMRLRFGRQGHSFVTPLCHRGTPFGMRRQLHRSHGSAYTLMFEAETENKHHAFQGASQHTSSGNFDFDSIELKNVAGHAGATGSGTTEALPFDEMTIGYGRENRKTYLQATYGHDTPNDEGRQIDYLIAPGQTMTNCEGFTEQVHFGRYETDLSVAGISGVTRLRTYRDDMATSQAPVRRHRDETASEIMVNGFIVSDYQLSGGRPLPSLPRMHFESQGPAPFVTPVSETNWFLVRGSEWGWITPRAATELATVPPLFAHDPDMMNRVDDSDTQNWDLGLLKENDTNTGCKPDAFLCNWLAEYSHPALMGTSREHFMMFRYREAGMPRAMQYPAVRGLFLRNHSRLALTEPKHTSKTANMLILNNSTTTSLTPYRSGMIKKAAKFERMYVLQWLQSYGYNGLNAGGHGVGTLKAASAVIMGNTTVREPRGTMRLPKIYNGIRYSRGESIGDSIDPEKNNTIALKAQRTSTGGYTIKHHFYMGLNPLVGFDYGRRLPVRAWGIRTASDALDMLAGDPHETQSATQASIFGKGRFDGGIHDSCAKILAPASGTHKHDFLWDPKFSGVERTTPIGMVMSGHTSEATPYSSSAKRLSNEPILPNEEPIGIGHSFGMVSMGLFKPTSLPAGMWVNEYDSTLHNSLDDVPVISKGSDPIIPSFDESGTGSQATSTIQTTTFGGTGYHLVGNALHTNSKDVRSITSIDTYPSNGWGVSDFAGENVIATPLSEITDHRQIMARAEPRMGLVTRTEGERLSEQNTDYLITSTKAASLHSDLILGQQFPITPSFIPKSLLKTHGNTRGTVAAPVGTTRVSVAMGDFYDEPPVFDLDRNTLKAAAVLSDTTESSARASAVDFWNVRGCADLPPWGGVFILRKTYLNRLEEEGPKSTMIYEHPTTWVSHRATASHPTRQYVDYVVRPFRPNKIFPFASELVQDGYLMGAYTKDTGNATRPSDNFYHRDKRYGIFELNMDKDIGMTEPLSSAYDHFRIEWPDPNNHDIVYHLIPSTALLEFFKSDANRISDGNLIPDIEPRYSQTTHPGGLEEVSQTQVRYSLSNTNIGGDYAAQYVHAEAVRNQPKDGNRNYHRVVVKAYYTNFSGTFMALDDASLLPNSGNLIFLNHAGSIEYTAKRGDTITINTTAATSPLLTAPTLPAGHTWVGKTLYYTKKSAGKAATSSTIRYPLSTGVVADVSPLVKKYPIAPTFIDNAITINAYSAESWYRHDGLKTTKTGISYRGLNSYKPSDFIMLTQRAFNINNGSGQGLIESLERGNKILRDSREITSEFFPPYIFDIEGKKWKISEIKDEYNGRFASFKNIDGDTLSDGGMEIGKVLSGQYATIGVRTTDAVMTLLNDASSSLAGYNLKETNAMLESGGAAEVIGVGGHPSLRDILDHSNTFISRNTRGLNILEVIRNASQLDGNQLLNKSSGVLIYSSQVFKETGKRLGSDSGARDISVSKMFDSPNVVAVEGDRIAQNETIFVEVKDVERMKTQAGAGSDQDVVRALRQEVPGLKTEKEALKLAKSLLSRVENGAPMVRIMGMIQATSLQPGDVITLDLSTHGLVGLFAIFEATHNYEEGTSDFVVAQYEKGIEGILSDIQASVGNMTSQERPLNQDRVVVSLSTSTKLVVVHRIIARNNNNTRMIIGHRSSPTDRKGAIGVQGGNKRALPIGMSKSRPFVVK